MTGTEIVVVAAGGAVLVTLVVAWLVVRRRSAHARRRLEHALDRLDEHARMLDERLRRAVERAADARARGVDDLELLVDFDEVLRRLAAEAAARTGSDASLLQVAGVGGEVATATFGAEDRPEPPSAPLAHGTGHFRAVAVNWSYPRGSSREDEYTSALVVPIVEDGIETGSIAVYAPAAGVFGADEIGALERLAEGAAAAVANARRFAEAQRAMTDAETGLRNRMGYEIGLEEEVARARDTGLPLSLLVLDCLEGAPEDEDRPPAGAALRELATLLLELTRGADVVARCGDRQLAVLLPGTTGEAARWLYGRLRQAAARRRFPLTRSAEFAAGVVEWRPDEPPGSFGERAADAARRGRAGSLALAAAPPLPLRAADPEARAKLRERLSEEIARARTHGAPLSLLVIDAEGADAAAAADSVEAHVRTSRPNGDPGYRIGSEEVAVILPEATSAEAEALFGELTATVDLGSLETAGEPHLNAGITQLGTGDDAGSLCDRAELALVRAKQAGRGTAVIATAADDAVR